MIHAAKGIAALAAGLASLLLVSLSAAPAEAGAPAPAVTIAQAGGCGAAIAAVESRTGGRVIQANMFVDGGRHMCRIVVLVPSRKPNQPPRRRVVVVPAG